MQNRSGLIRALVVFITTILQGVANAGGLQKTPAPTPGWTMSRFLKTAFQKNQDIAAARLRWQETVQKGARAGALPDPMLMLSDVFQNQSPLAITQRQVQITQEFPWPTRRGLERRMAANEVEMSLLQYEMSVRETLTSVKQAVAELWYAREAIRLTEEHRVRLDRHAMALSGPVAKDETPLQELGLVWTNLARSGYDLEVLRRQQHLAQAELNVLLGRSIDRPLLLRNGLLTWPEATQDAASVKALEKLMAAHQQELRMAGLNLEMAYLKTEGARLAVKPDFILGYSKNRMVGLAPDMGGGMPQNMAMKMDMWSFGVSLPIWREKYRSERKEAELHLESASANNRGQWNQARLQLRQTLNNLLSSEQLVNLYGKTLLPKARDFLEKSQTLFRENVEPAASLLQAETVYFQYQLAFARACADYAKHRSALENLMGVPLLKLPGTEKRKKP